MTHHDDDQLIANAFGEFDEISAPALTVTGTAPLHIKAAQYRRRNRITIISAACVLAVALPVATYAALGQQNQGPPTPTASGEPTLPASPSATPSDSPSPSASQIPQKGFGVAYFAVPTQLKVEIYSYSAGKATLLTTIGPDDYGYVQHTISMSPDGTKLAWVDNSGALEVSALNGSSKRTLLTGVSTAGMEAPMWTLDSRRLVTSTKTVDVETMQVTGGGLKGRYQVWAPGAQFTAYAAASGPARVIVERADASRFAEFRTTCSNCESNQASVLALSPDGRYVALGGWPTTGEREHSWREIVDVQTGTKVNIGLPGAPNSGRFLADGTVVIHTRDKIQVMRLDGTIVDTTTMPAELRVQEGQPTPRYPELLLVK
jgi:TolB protein